jgi:hypothetical protein
MLKTVKYMPILVLLFNTVLLKSGENGPREKMSHEVASGIVKQLVPSIINTSVGLIKTYKESLKHLITS